MSFPLVRSAFPRLIQPTAMTASITAIRSKSHNANTSGNIPWKDEVSPTPKESTGAGTHNEIAHQGAAFNRNTNPAGEKGDVGREVRYESSSTTTSTLCYAAAVGARAPDTDMLVMFQSESWLRWICHMPLSSMGGDKVFRLVFLLG